LSPELEENYLIWRPVLEGIATLKEVQTEWSLQDIKDCCAYLDMKADYEMVFNQIQIDDMNKGK
jgi:hypothetical protein